MNQYLRKNEPCPIHAGSRWCSCHRPTKSPQRKLGQLRGPVRKVEDPHHPRGYREICTPSELKRRKHVAIVKQRSLCWLCGEAFTTFLEVEVHHIKAKGMGAAFRDDSQENLAAVHSRMSDKGCHGKIHDGRAA